MNDQNRKLQLFWYALFVVSALVIIADYIIPGSVFNDEIINVKRERQQYYNAARNYHYSYELITSEHQFSVSEDFVQLLHNKEKIQYSVSLIFKEVNWYKLLSSKHRDVYSLRILSGLVLPLLIIITMFVSYQYKRNFGILVFVLQILLILDLILLMT